MRVESERVVTTLGECCEIVSGSTPRRDHPEYWDGDIPWATPRDISRLDIPVLSQTEEQISQAGYDSSSTRMLPPGAVLFSSRAPVGLVAIAGRAMCTNQGFKSLIPGPRVDSGYLFWFLKRAGKAIERSGNATTFIEVSKAAMARVLIPLPPLAEQRRIAALLDRADAVRRKREESRRLVDELLRSVFLEMFGDPVRNEKGWEVVKVGDLCRVLGGKRLPKGSSYSEVPTPFRYVRATDINHGRVDESNLRYLTPEVQARISRYTVAEGDVIITIAGTIGELAPVAASVGGANLTENAAKLCPREPDTYDPVFLADLLRSPGVKSSFVAETGQVTIKKLALYRIERVMIPVPPLDLQRGYAERTRKIERLREGVVTATSSTDALGARIQNDLFGKDGEGTG